MSRWLSRTAVHRRSVIVEHAQLANLLRNLLIRNLGADSVVSWPENRDPQSRKDDFLEGNLAAWKGRDARPLGGAAAPPLFDSRNFGVWAQFWLKKPSVWPRFGGFLSKRQPVPRHLAANGSQFAHACSDCECQNDGSARCRSGTQRAYLCRRLRPWNLGTFRDPCWECLTHNGGELY